MSLKTISTLLFVVGAFGVIAGSAMFGDIGIAAMTAGVVGILAGLGFRALNKSN